MRFKDFLEDSRDDCLSAEDSIDESGKTSGTDWEKLPQTGNHIVKVQDIKIPLCVWQHFQGAIHSWEMYEGETDCGYSSDYSE